MSYLISDGNRRNIQKAYGAIGEAMEDVAYRMDAGGAYLNKDEESEELYLNLQMAGSYLSAALKLIDPLNNTKNRRKSAS